MWSEWWKLLVGRMVENKGQQIASIYDRHYYMDQDRAENSWRGNSTVHCQRHKYRVSAMWPRYKSKTPPPPPPLVLREIAFIDNWAPNKYFLCLSVLILRPHLCISNLWVEAISFRLVQYCPTYVCTWESKLLAGSCMGENHLLQRKCFGS